MSLHTGKLDARIETSVPEAFSDLLGAKAHALGVTKADLVRDLLFLAATGETYSFHVAKDKSIATKVLLADMRDRSGTDAGRL
jgi:hypothetical protein